MIIIRIFLPKENVKWPHWSVQSYQINNNRLELSDYYFSPLSENDILTYFDCDDQEINEFLIEDSQNFQKEKITNTFLFKDTTGKIIAFFSISNDCLNDLGYENSVWNKLHRKINLPNQKRIRQ